jgi:hypothetical protein
MHEIAIDTSGNQSRIGVNSVKGLFLKVLSPRSFVGIFLLLIFIN